MTDMDLKYEALDSEHEMYKKWLQEEQEEKSEIKDSYRKLCAENAVLLNENDCIRSEYNKLVRYIYERTGEKYPELSESDENV